MALRVAHVPSIVSLQQLQDDQQNVPACKQLVDTTPLYLAEGACVPLYEYTVAKELSLAEQSDAEDFAVPEYRSDEDADAWVQSQVANSKGLREAHNKSADVAPATLYHSPSWAAQMMPNSELVVPFLNTKAAAAAAKGQLHVMVSDPALGDHASQAPTPASLFGSILSDDDAEAMLLTDGASRLMSSGSSMDISPRASVPADKHTTSDAAVGAEHHKSTLDTVLSALWEECNARGLFRYDVAQCATKLVPGRWGWVAQLNEGRASKKRPTELRVDAVMQPFDANKFHFGKAYLREVLLQFQPLGTTQLPSGLHGWAASDDGGARMWDSSRMGADPTLVMINVSPIEYGHMLLTPRVLSQLPQQLTHAGLSAALAFVREMANPSFRLGYNSLGAYATINHLHFQGYFLDSQLPCERAATMPLPGFAHDTLRVSVLVDYPVHGWVVELQPHVEQLATEADMTTVLMQLCGHLQAVDQPFNVFMVEHGRRVFIWPQCYAERQAAGEVPQDMLDTGVNPAVFEVAGHLVLKRAQDYGAVSDEWAYRLLSGVSLTREHFEALTHAVFAVAASAAA